MKQQTPIADAPPPPALSRQLLRRVVLAAILLPSPTLAQVRAPGAPTLGEESVSIGSVSRPVHDGSLTVREGSVGSMKSRPVHDGSSRSMKSGPVSDISRGPVTAHWSLSGSESVVEASAGAVKKDIDSPLGERISAPISELVDLQQVLRQRVEDDPLIPSADTSGGELRADPIGRDFDAAASELYLVEPNAPGE